MIATIRLITWNIFLKKCYLGKQDSTILKKCKLLYFVCIKPNLHIYLSNEKILEKGFIEFNLNDTYVCIT